MNNLAELEKCRGPLHMAVTSSRAEYVADYAGSMHGIERASKLGLPNLQGRKRE